MLANLIIRDFAIIEHLEVDFDAGMTVLTGETGAGKSIIIDALGLLVGGRGSSDFIRSKAKKTDIQGLFVVAHNPRLFALLAEHDIEPDGQNVLLERELSRTGRNVCRINGKIVTTSVLRTIGEQLVDIHGQNEHQELMNPEHHLAILDQYGQATIAPLLATYQQIYRRYRDLKRQLEDKQKNEQAYVQRLDMLRFQLQEIDSAKVQAREDELLTQERQQLMNFQKISLALQQSLAMLTNEEPNALDLTAVAMEQMNSIADLSPKYQELADHLDSAYYELQDVGTGLQDQLDVLEFDADRLSEIEQRLEIINNLKRKYGPSLTDVQSYEQKIAAEYQQMKQVTDAGDQIETEYKTVRTNLLAAAQKLTQARHEVSEQLAQAIHQQLASLYMDKAVFAVHFQPQKTPNFTHAGQDQVAFYLRTNPGEDLKPLVKIASGGELSRIMLAIKTIIAHSEGVTSIIFDEVDTGVSGRVAQAIADKINLIARYSQVLCITHLPQVAAMSDHQYLIEKTIQHDATTTSLHPVTGEERVEVIAKMIAGKEVTTLAEEHAAELVAQAAASKRERDL
ncbi:DNA repair protein RecN [Lapidilactobacillus achengensis]|uniref:DNA repair protein RecN n=1 Tax=Lapidilactobacillus achengensis TaxID=2486000 RepID=A0ABW1UQP6_9LACO|nr:DNA repair protein RecN [Lapidilactobacillus achengensis]